MSSENLDLRTTSAEDVRQGLGEITKLMSDKGFQSALLELETSPDALREAIRSPETWLKRHGADAVARSFTVTVEGQNGCTKISWAIKRKRLSSSGEISIGRNCGDGGGATT